MNENGSYIPTSMRKSHLKQWHKALKHFMPVSSEINKAIDKLTNESEINVKSSKKLSYVIAVDFDGTLAEYYGDFTTLGKPIEKMVARVKNWLTEGKTVVVFTARANQAEQVELIKAWLTENELPELEVTNIKSPEFKEIWDDRAVQVILNTGVEITKFKNKVDEALEQIYIFRDSKLGRAIGQVKATSKLQAINSLIRTKPDMENLNDMIEKGDITVEIEGMISPVINRSSNKPVCPNCGSTSLGQSYDSPDEIKCRKCHWGQLKTDVEEAIEILVNY